MNIKYYGHSCFEITCGNGVRILTDPFDRTVGYNVPSVHADIVSVSHSHYDHNYTREIKGKYDLLNKVGDFQVKDISIRGILSYHDEFQGAKRGNNIIFTFDDGAVKVCHLGDLGHLLNDKQLSQIGGVDVLLIPVGGFFTIDCSNAVKVIEQIAPSIVIPMHYKTDVVDMPIDGVEPFVKAVGVAKRLDSQNIEINNQMLEGKKKVFVLRYE